MKNLPLMILAAVGLWYLTRKRVTAVTSTTLNDYSLNDAGVLFPMLSGSEYKAGETIGTVIKDPAAEQFGEIVIRSAKNKNIYHTISKSMVPEYFKI